MEKKKWARPTISGPFSIADSAKIEEMFKSEIAQYESHKESRTSSTFEGPHPIGGINKIQRKVKRELSGVAVKTN